MNLVYEPRFRREYANLPPRVRRRADKQLRLFLVGVANDFFLQSSAALTATLKRPHDYSFHRLVPFSRSKTFYIETEPTL